MMEILNFWNWPHFLNQTPPDPAGSDPNQLSQLVGGLGLSLTGFLLLTFVSTLLIIFLIPIVIEVFRRLRGPHQRDIFTHHHT